jgi:hypothetical protein
MTTQSPMTLERRAEIQERLRLFREGVEAAADGTQDEDDDNNISEFADHAPQDIADLLQENAELLAGVTDEPRSPHGGGLYLNAYGRLAFDAGAASVKAEVERLTQALREVKAWLGPGVGAWPGQPNSWDRLHGIVEAALEREGGSLK